MKTSRLKNPMFYIIAVVIAQPLQAVLFMYARTLDRLALVASALPSPTSVAHELGLSRNVAHVLLGCMVLDVVLLLIAAIFIQEMMAARSMALASNPAPR
jgi:cytochrome b561